MSRRLSLIVLGVSVVTMAGVSVWSCGGGETSTNDGGNDGTTSDVSTPDTGTKDSSTNDSATDASDGAVGPRCTSTKPFGAVTLVAELGSADGGASGARLTNDSLTIYYAAANGGNGIVQTASRAAPTSTFGASTPLYTLADAALPGFDPSVSPDGLTIYTQFNPSNYVEVVFGTRVSVSSNFNYSTGVTGLSGGPPNHGAPFLQGDNSTLWYAARIEPDGGPTQGAGSLDIFSAQVTGAGQITGLTAVPDITTPADESSPAVTSDGLTIFLARKIGVDGGASGTFHVYSSTRAATSDPFPAPVLVTELDDVPTSNTNPTWISPDDCVIFLQSDRGGPAGAIYTAVRPL